MGKNAGIGRTHSVDLGTDDPNLTQEEKDHRLALAMQQQENAAALSLQKKKKEQQTSAQNNRTARSGTFSKLAAVRDKDHGMLSVPAAYTSDNAYKIESNYASPGFVPPAQHASAQEVADHKIAAELQKVEQVDAGTVRTMNKLVKEEQAADKSDERRTIRNKHTL